MSQDWKSYIGEGHWWFSGSVVACMCFVNAASFSSKNIFVLTFERSFEEKSTTFRKHIFRAFRWLQAESKEPNPQKYLC